MIAWLFIILVAAYDCYFMWLHGDYAAEWEINPIALKLAECIGVWAAISFRVLTLAIAAATIALLSSKRRRFATLVVAAIHLALCVAYLAG